jgi:YVTN family beta-propeller protein
VIAALAVVAAAAIAAAVAVLIVGGGSPQPPTGALVRIDPATNRIAATVRLSQHPDQVAAGAGQVWVAAFRDGMLWRYTPATGELSRVSTVGDPRDVALLGGSAFVSADGPTVFQGTVLRYDAATGERDGGLSLETCAITGGDGVVWTAGCPFVERLGTGAGPLRIVRSAPIPAPAVETASNQRQTLVDLAVGDGSVWVLGDAVDHRLWRLDDRTGAPQATISLPFVGRSLAYGEGALWVTAQLDDVVGRVDPAANRLARTVAVGRGASGVAVGEGAVWVANRVDGTVSRVDPATMRVTKTIRVHGNAVDVATGDGAVWVTTDEGP